jgi:hypothetical protein
MKYRTIKAPPGSGNHMLSKEVEAVRKHLAENGPRIGGSLKLNSLGSAKTNGSSKSHKGTSLVALSSKTDSKGKSARKK